MPQLRYETNFYPSFEGRRADNTGRTIKVINAAPQAAQVDTITINSTGTAGDVKSAVIDGVTVSITVPATPTVAAVALLLAAAINNEPLLGGRILAEAAAAVVTLTARLPGIGWTVDSADAAWTAASVTSNAQAESVPFGRFIIRNGQSTTYQGVGGQAMGRLAKASYFTAQVDNLALTFDDTVLWTVSINVAGQTYSATVTQGTSATASVALMVTALNAVLPANTVLASASTSTLVLTSELAGLGFESSWGFGTGADTAAIVKTSNKGVATDLNLAALGISEATDYVEKSVPQVGQLGSDAALYPPNYVMNVRLGRIDVRLENSGAAVGDDVYVRLAANGSNTTLAGFRSSADTGCVKLLGARVHEVRDQGQLATIEYYERGLSY